MAWQKMPDNIAGVDDDNNSGGYDGTIPTGTLGHGNQDPDGGYGPGPQYPDAGQGVTGQLGYKRPSGDGYGSSLLDGNAFEGPQG